MMSEPSPKKYVRIDPVTLEAEQLWSKVLQLAKDLGTDGSWTLIGGLMVQLHAFESGVGSRPTVDIDLLGDSRSRPATTVRLAELLVTRGAEMALPPVGGEDLGYRFELNGETIEVLGSEGVRRDPNTIGRLTTIQVSGGTQALARSETVAISLAGASPIELRRPSLLGAILIKARAVALRRDAFQADRQDLTRLLSLVEDPRGLAADEGIRKSERRWLKDVESALDFDGLRQTGLFSREQLIRGEQAFRLLID